MVNMHRFASPVWVDDPTLFAALLP